jgi:hypothetical protein
MVVANLAIGLGWPAIMEQFSVNPNRAEKEREYIARNIESTRQAYGIETRTDTNREGYEDENGEVVYERDWGGDSSGDASDRRSIADDDATPVEYPPAGPRGAVPDIHPAATVAQFLRLPR